MAVLDDDNNSDAGGIHSKQSGGDRAVVFVVVLVVIVMVAVVMVVGFPGGSDGEASGYNAGDPGSIPGLGRSPGEGNCNPLQSSCLENPMDGGAW